MLAIIIVGVFIGLLLTAFAAPIIIVMNRQKLKEMDELITNYQRLLPDQRAARRLEISRNLLDIKNSIWAGDKQSVEAARDKLGLI
jgi:hypothetical protein